MMGACPTTVGPALALGGLEAAGRIQDPRGRNVTDYTLADAIPLIV
jgi:hypothetical protein